jgi:hypothetical protein
MNDLQQISFDLKQVTGRSLLLIDEFGKGTNESGVCLSNISSTLPELNYDSQMASASLAGYSTIC